MESGKTSSLETLKKLVAGGLVEVYSSSYDNPYIKRLPALSISQQLGFLEAANALPLRSVPPFILAGKLSKRWSSCGEVRRLRAERPRGVSISYFTISSRQRKRTFCLSRLLLTKS